MNVFNGAYIQMGRPTGRSAGQVSCFFLLKETRLNVWFASTSLPPIMKHSTKLWCVGLDLAKVAGATSVVLYCDFQVVTNQVNEDYECKGQKMKKYLE